MKYTSGRFSTRSSCSSTLSSTNTTERPSSFRRTKPLPRTLIAGVPYQRSTATSGSSRASAQSSSQVIASPRSGLDRRALAQRGEELAPPHAHHADERLADLTVARRMVGPDRGPAAVRDRDQRAGRARLEQHLDLGLLGRREVHRAPLEHQARR